MTQSKRQYLPGTEIAKDGEVVRTPMVLMDAVQAAIAPKPDPMAARDADIKRKSNAWKARG